MLQPEPGQVAYFPVVDSIQEFEIETNSPPAEFGRFNGGVINLTTRSGSNEFHGTAFEFFSDEGTITSTVPTLLQRQGVFTEPIGGVVPRIFDPATTVSNGSGGFVRTPFADGRVHSREWIRSPSRC